MYIGGAVEEHHDEAHGAGHEHDDFGFADATPRVVPTSPPRPARRSGPLS
ncbi:MAG: hypothetical protein WKG07_21315 [Hymenobacter sp.]